MKKTKRVFSAMLSLLLLALTLSCVSVCFTASAYDFIEFGNYPQTQVTLTTEMKEAALAARWESYGYYTGHSNFDNYGDGTMAPGDFMRYADFFFNGIKYRAVTFSHYRPWDSWKESSAEYSYQDDYGFTTGNIYCFQYEPLKWRVLDFVSGLVMCEDLIDAQAYNSYVIKSADGYYGNASKDYFSSNYYYSAIRKWLNEDFYNTAFNNVQKEKIKTTTLDNSAAENDKYSAPSSNDKIFLLSLHDAKGYCFSSSEEVQDAARTAKGTDYAKCQGLYRNTDETDISSWLLRTPGNSQIVKYVTSDGWIYSTYVYDTHNGIRPACCLTALKSDTTPPEQPAPEVPVIDSAKAKEQDGSVFTVPEMKADELLGFAGDGAKLTKPDDSEVKADDLVGTGMVLTKADGTKETVVVKGDYNGDGLITTADARMALRTAIGLETPNDAQKKACLVTGGEEIGTGDARMILRAAIGLDTLALV